TVTERPPSRAASGVGRLGRLLAAVGLGALGAVGVSVEGLGLPSTAVFFGVGAYTTGILAHQLGWSPLATAPLRGTDGSAARRPGGSAGPEQFGAAEAAEEVIVDQPGRLHEGVGDRGPHEAEPAPPEVAAERAGLGALGRHLRGRPPGVDDRPAAHEAPDVPVEAAELALHLQEGPGVADGRLDLGAVPDDAVVGEQAPRVPRGVAGDRRRVEAGERP